MDDSSLKDILLNMADDIRSMDTRIDDLKSLLTSMQNKHFDTQEIAATQSKIEEESMARTEKLKLLQQKLHVYESHVVGLEERIVERKQIIDTCKPTPDLLHLFAQTQAQLNEELETAHMFLRS